MSEFSCVASLSDLALLDEQEILEGYLHGMRGNHDEPGSDRSRSFWNGWRNAMTDRGILPALQEQAALAREIVKRYMGLN